MLVSQVSQAPATRDLKLPATIRGFDETDIYAKVPGYLKTIKVDKGDRIHKGQLLAILTSPELDQQVANARANYNLALITDQRNQALVHAQVIPQQTADESHGAMLQAKATLEQDVANQHYETITAPFDGIVTARYIDPGHLVPANTSPGTPGSGAIISISRYKPLRVFTYVPQNIAPFIRNGDAATITAAGYPGQKFTGTITRHPDALSPDTRTMLVEVDLPNENQALYPGMYATAEFTVAMGTGRPDGPRRRVGIPRRQSLRPGRPQQPVAPGRGDARLRQRADRGSPERHQPDRQGRSQRRPGRPRRRKRPAGREHEVACKFPEVLFALGKRVGV